MRKGQDRNINRAGKAGCLGLLALGFALINPVGSMAFAEGEEVADEAGVPATQEDIPSTVGISFSPATGSTSLSPTTSGGTSAQVNVLATVSVANSGGYSVYLKSNSLNLVGTKSSANVIPGATAAKTYANMDVNTWGYAAAEGTMVPDDVTYKAISVSGNGDKVAENNNKKIVSDTKKIMLSFAAKVNDQKPADTYKNTVTMSVVSSPLQTTLTDITNMQDMTSAICTASAMYETKQLKDTRDGKFYWVTKLGDGKCWMTQNLDLDLSTGTKLTADTSDVPAAGWTPGYTTVTTVTDSTVLADNIGQRSWSLGDYRIINPDVPDSCGSKKSSAADCGEQFTAYNTPTTENRDVDAHYILGNHYQWNAATAGTGGAITSGQATNSICAKGWRLPTSGSGGELDALVTALGGASSSENVTRAPFYGVRGGYVAQITDLFNYAGEQGRYWASTPNSGGDNAYHLAFYAVTVLPSNNYARYFGSSVRCVAR